MTQPYETQPTDELCPHCDARQLGPAERCWLCNNLLDAKISYAPYGVSPKPETFSFSLSTLFLIITLASICMGLFVAAPGLGIFACMVMVPVFFRTIRVVRRREQLGQAVSRGEKIAMFFGSFVVSSVLVIVVCVAAFCSFCGVCLTIVTVSGDAQAWPFAIGIGALAIGSIFLALKINRWNRKRYRQEMGEG